MDDRPDMTARPPLPSPRAKPAAAPNAAAAAANAEPMADLQRQLEEQGKQLNRLIGERNQLQALLASRDRDLERLSREAGGLRQQLMEQDASAAKPARAAWSSLLARWLRRREPPVNVPAAAAPSPPLPEPQPGEGWPAPLVPQLAGRSGGPLLAAALFGLGRDEIARLLPVIEQQCRNHGMQPLILTDHDGFDLLRARRLVFEYLPPAAARAQLGRTLPWQTYLQRRLAVIRRKWQPVRIVAFGPEALAMIQLWRASPFEPSEIPALVPPGESAMPQAPDVGGPFASLGASRSA